MNPDAVPQADGQVAALVCGWAGLQNVFEMPDLAVIFIKVVKNKGGGQLRVLNLCGKCLLGAAYSSSGSVFTCSSYCNPWQQFVKLEPSVRSAGSENKRSVFLQATSSPSTAAAGRRTTRWFIGATAR